MTGQPRDVAAALARAFLAEGGWTKDALCVRGYRAMGGRRAYVRVAVDEVLWAYRTPPRDRPRELAAFLAEAEPFRRALRRARPVARTVRVQIPAAPPDDPPRWRGLPDVRTAGGLADHLGLTAGELLWYSDPRSQERRADTEPLRHYSYRWVPTRSGGQRLLERPKPVLRILQRRVLDEIVARIPGHAASHGFVPARSVRTFAAPHAGRAVVVRVDLVGFFPSVTAPRVYGTFRSCGYGEDVAHALTGLTTNAAPPWALRDCVDPGKRIVLRAPHLPQGAPTSPGLANAVAFTLDRRLTGLAAAWGWTYTRYADDLAFSGDDGRPLRLVDAVAAIAAQEGFRLNEFKTRIQRTGSRQVLTGLVVNDRPRVSRSEYDRLRAVLHDAALHGPETANKLGHSHFRDHLLGRIAWVGEGEPRRAAILRAAFERISWPV